MKGKKEKNSELHNSIRQNKKCVERQEQEKKLF